GGEDDQFRAGREGKQDRTGIDDRSIAAAPSSAPATSLAAGTRASWTAALATRWRPAIPTRSSAAHSTARRADRRAPGRFAVVGIDAEEFIRRAQPVQQAVLHDGSIEENRFIGIGPEDF